VDYTSFSLRFTLSDVYDITCDGIRVAQFNGAEAGQTVFHLHVHIIPCYKGETLNAHAGGMIDKDALDKLAALIAKEL